MNIFNKVYSLLSEEYWMKTFGKAKYKRIKELLVENKISLVLEMGCAEGYIIRRLLIEKVISKAVGIDIRKQKLEKAMLRSRKEKLQNKILFKYGDATKLPFKDNSFDGVIIPDVLEHLKNKKEVIDTIKEAKRIAKKLVIITIPQINNLKDYWILLEPDHLRMLLKYNNFWLYNKNKFVSLLNRLNLDYKNNGKYSFSTFYSLTKIKV